MLKQLLTKLDQQIAKDNEEWDFCDGYGTYVRWPSTGGQIVKHCRNSMACANLLAKKDAEDLF